jgi:hypothetical protein
MTQSESESLETDYNIFMPKARTSFQLLRKGKIYRTQKSDSAGKISFSMQREPDSKDIFEIRPDEKKLSQLLF